MPDTYASRHVDSCFVWISVSDCKCSVGIRSFSEAIVEEGNSKLAVSLMDNVWALSGTDGWQLELCSLFRGCESATRIYTHQKSPEKTDSSPTLKQRTPIWYGRYWGCYKFPIDLWGRKTLLPGSGWIQVVKAFDLGWGSQIGKTWEDLEVATIRTWPGFLSCFHCLQSYIPSYHLNCTCTTALSCPTGVQITYSYIHKLHKAQSPLVLRNQTCT